MCTRSKRRRLSALFVMSNAIWRSIDAQSIFEENRNEFLDLEDNVSDFKFFARSIV